MFDRYLGLAWLAIVAMALIGGLITGNINLIGNAIIGVTGFALGRIYRDAR